MGEVEPMSTASLVAVEPRDPAHPDVRACFDAYATEPSAHHWFEERFDAQA